MGFRQTFVALTLVSLGAAPAGAAGRTELISVDSRERPGNDWSHSADVSADGRKIVFSTFADDLARKSAGQVVLRDRRRGNTRLVSRSSTGKLSNHGGSLPRISPNGRFVVWCSWATNLVKPDRFGYDMSAMPDEKFLDVFVRDMRRGITRRASTARDGGMANEASCLADVADNGDVAFESYASNLVRRDRDEEMDVFVYDWSRRSVRMVSLTAEGRRVPHYVGGPGISADARVVTFEGDAKTFTGKTGPKVTGSLLYFRRSGKLVALREPKGVGDQGHCDMTSTSATVRFVLLACYHAWSDPEQGTVRGAQHLYRLDRRSNDYERITPISLYEDNGASITDAAMTQDGRYASWCTDNVYDESTRGEGNVYVADVGTGKMNRVVNDPDLGAGLHCDVALPEGGRRVIFETAFPLVRKDSNDDPDIYLRHAPFERP